MHADGQVQLYATKIIQATPFDHAKKFTDVENAGARAIAFRKVQRLAYVSGRIDGTMYRQLGSTPLSNDQRQEEKP